MLSLKWQSGFYLPCRFFFTSGLQHAFVLFSDSIAQPAPGRCRFERVWDFPTSILQRKNSRCIYVCPACGYNVIDETKIVSSKTVIWLCRFPKNSNIEVLTGAKRFIFLTPYSLASFCERFQVSDLIHTMPWHRRIGSDFLFCIIVYNTWTKRVGNLDYESINFCCGNQYTVVKGGE